MSDPVTGLTWTRALAGPLSWDEAKAAAAALRTSGHADWRVPGIKELYTLIDFRGRFAPTTAQSRPFIDTAAFEFAYAEGGRFFDVQLWSATPYPGCFIRDAGFARMRARARLRERGAADARRHRRALERNMAARAPRKPA